MGKRKRHFTDVIEVEKYIDYLKRKIKQLKKKVKKEKSNAS